MLPCTSAPFAHADLPVKISSATAIVCPEDWVPFEVKLPSTPNIFIPLLIFFATKSVSPATLIIPFV